jgi:O-antigen/teichoic acid export membrane protein
MAPAFVLLVRTWPTDPEAFRHNWRGAFTLMTVAAFGSAAGFAVFARPVVVFLFGARYEPAVVLPGSWSSGSR